MPALTVAVALTKGDKPELAVQKLTELGVDRILLVAAARSVVRWDDAKTAANLDRLRRVAREAGQQCRRARLPEIDGPVTPGELAGDPACWSPRPTGSRPPSCASRTAGSGRSRSAPRAASTPTELAAFGDAPHLAVGPHVLRAETAAIAVAATLAAHREPGG